MRILKQLVIATLAIAPMAAAPTMTLDITSPCPRVSLDGVSLRATVSAEPRDLISGVTFMAQRNGYVVTAPASAVHVGANGHDNQAVFVPLLPGRWYFKSSAHVRPVIATRLGGVEVTAQTDQSLLCEIKPTTLTVGITTVPATLQHLGNPVKVTITASYNSFLAPYVKNYTVEIRSLSGTLIAQQTNQTSDNQFSWSPTFASGGSYRISAAVNVYAPGPQGEELLGLGSFTANYTIVP